MASEIENLMEQLGIAIPKKKAAQYFYGDNLDGYFEGFTHRYAEGAGYVVRQRAIYRDFLSWCGDRPNDREIAEGAVIYPYGVRHLHGPSWWDEFMLLRRRRAVALRVYSRRPQSLAVAPLLAWDARLTHVKAAEGAALITHEKASVQIAVSSSQPFRHTGDFNHGKYFAPVFRTLQDETEFTLYVAFARDPESAIAQAQKLREGDAARQHIQSVYLFLTKSNFWTSDDDYNRALAWAKLTSYFMVSEEFTKGIWAGLPWFKDNWGRDTFIAFPGTLLVTGMFEDAKDVLRGFARYQNKDKKSPVYGRVPNRVAGPNDIIYNTTDGTPWMIREILELLHYTGDLKFAGEMYPVVKLALDGAIKNFADKKGFLTHDDADTWMDARIEGKLPWSARGNRANDIQVLWFTALLAGARLADIAKDRASAKKWRDLAAKVRNNFPRLFWNAKKKVMADRVTAKDKPDFKVRPNQLMLVSVPVDERFIDEKVEERVVANAAGELLYPYGIASLSQKDPYFHPVHHDDAHYHYDSAYHNGTVWGWNAGFTTTALCRHGQMELAWELAKNLSDQILNMGCRGSMSELVDAIPDKKGNITLSGTWAQAWSTAEFARNGCQDFGGFRPRLLDGRIELEPRIPEGWTSFSGIYPFGRDASLLVAFTRQHGKEVYVIRMEQFVAPLKIRFAARSNGKLYAVEQDIKHGDTLTVVIDKKAALTGVNGKWNQKPLKGTPNPPPRPLKFVKPSLAAKPRAMKEKDFLRKIIESGKYA